MAKWSASSEVGILRKKVVKDKHEDLLVFGYACKLFRDDEKALFIDQGKHLIPWMGNDNLKIDRYDCRGALSELQQYEASKEDYDTLRWLGLNENERRLEILCDEERYYSLKHNEEELEMYKEEELKRLQQKGNEVQYNYDVPTDPENSEDTTDLAEQDELFTPSPDLGLAEDIEVPKTVKENARIVKTAAFISKQGAQMEILIKTKQADNPQFSFMNNEDKLYKYYKHLLSAIKEGKYKVHFAEEESNTEQNHDESIEQEGHEEHYLHPSLIATSSQLTSSPMPMVTYKPSADCAYSQLVNRIQGTHADSTTSQPSLPEANQSSAIYDQQQQYYQQYYYAVQYYEYYKQMAQQLQEQSPEALPQENPFSQMDVFSTNQNAQISNQFDMQSILQSQAAYMQYMQQQQPNIANPYAQIVSNLSQNKDMSGAPYSNLTQTEAIPGIITQNNDITKAPILYEQSEQQINNIQNTSQNLNSQSEIGKLSSIPTLRVNIEDSKEKNNETNQDFANKPPLLSIAQYGSDTENENSSEDETLVNVPSTEIRQIIDKMASYVMKNGKDFENIVKSKGDPRFEFLNSNHIYYPYYILQVKSLSKKVSHYNKNEDKKKKDLQNGNINKLKEKVVTPVSFSIKKSKDEITKEIKSALPVEESDDDHDDISVSKTVPSLPVLMIADLPSCNSNTIITPSTSNTSSFNHNSATPEPRPTSPGCETPPLKELSTSSITTDEITNQKVYANKNIEESDERIVPLDSDDLILEMIDLTADFEEKGEIKQVKYEDKDKIALDDREKLALQLERKKKAAAFLKLKSVETKSDKYKIKCDKPSKSRKSKDKQELDRTSKHSHSKKAKRLKTKEKSNEEVLRVEDSESEEEEVKRKKHAKKKKSHKRNRSRSRHASKSHKKSKKHRKRSASGSSRSTTSH